ncbi:MAG TPA: exodeoxyribonuclease VII large subunit [Spirochaetota bacterium]|nr:exodeoxyribonuclease VII large subunit [Spirochaetota bacterium]HPC39297.1 exodeoxyribonuclease VII large subunit [Spirochaetota bacterium]HPL16840.1 exodeoxyribonuclease VII large subunit [Spirochaetota bacterium]HQF08765.1 exodeoxyribonuclease VII large subunit [Spirochaetota bacterium]HQH97534.1 exodeoxyribonuclease VII large subunit [Spirochaetota bacterium]
MNDNSTLQRVYTVAELTRSIKRTLEGRADFNNLWVKGEIFNLTVHSSGHIYFSLRDNEAVISAVFFRHANRNLAFKLKEGMNILALGSITVYEKRGSYQINVAMVKQEGLGELQKRIEMLKQKLAAEGVFSPDRKRPIPFLPRRLGVATSPTGAAVQDIIKVALRRYPTIEIIIAPAVVQGADAPVSIARAIEELNRPEYRIDCIIAGRGGGSFEDLMPFNEEIVVRAFYNSRVPIISAVGHQIDHPLCDDAADLFAPTPSAAAELAVPVKEDLEGEVEYLAIRASNAVGSLLRELNTRVEGIRSRRIFRDPYEIVNRKEQLLGDMLNQMLSSLKDKVSSGTSRLLSIPDIRMIIKNLINTKKHSYIMALTTMEQLSPMAVLQRGYAIAMDEEGQVIRSVDDSGVDSLIRLLLSDGTLRCRVNSIERGGSDGKEKNS